MASLLCSPHRMTDANCGNGTVIEQADVACLSWQLPQQKTVTSLISSMLQLHPNKHPDVPRPLLVCTKLGQQCLSVKPCPKALPS